MILDHSLLLSSLRNRFAANWQFFAPQRSFNYTLSQENCHFTHKSLPRAEERSKL